MKRESGQAAVESALILPLFVFLILGTLQLGLMHQARLMTKYAAYKAVRAGSLHNANMKKMERAAVAVLLPLVSRGSNGAETLKTINSASDFQAKWGWDGVKDNMMSDAQVPFAQVVICGPLSSELPGGAREVDFDDPAMTASEDWAQGQRTKLRIQVTFNYRMPIPFANMVIFNIT
ncbi:TadE/TadG family type IV pilus assembly protein, partial [Pyxidicoccus sp. 3LG]